MPLRYQIQILGWNHRPYLQRCIDSCLKISAPEDLIYIDNDSRDGSADFVEKNYPGVRVVRTGGNKGYAGGHNLGLGLASGKDIAILLNPDLEVGPAFVEKMHEAFVSGGRVGAAVPLLLRKQAGKVEDAVVDAYGIKLSPSLRGVNICEGAALGRCRVGEIRPWGFTGAAVALSLDAVRDAAPDGRFFDEDLHSYREDVDASWRLAKKGWAVRGCPEAVAYHERKLRKGGPKSAHTEYLSVRNYYLVIAKNAGPFRLLAALPFVLAETAARAVAGIWRPAVRRALRDAFKALPSFLRKRKVALL